jgi:hypothetical protein
MFYKSLDVLSLSPTPYSCCCIHQTYMRLPRGQTVNNAPSCDITLLPYVGGLHDLNFARSVSSQTHVAIQVKILARLATAILRNISCKSCKVSNVAAIEKHGMLWRYPLVAVATVLTSNTNSQKAITLPFTSRYMTEPRWQLTIGFVADVLQRQHAVVGSRWLPV